jgi:hypothetical protein
MPILNSYFFSEHGLSNKNHLVEKTGIEKRAFLEVIVYKLGMVYYIMTYY